MLTRREFIKHTGSLSALAAFMPSLGVAALSGNQIPHLSQSFTLKGYDDEQEETPALVNDGNGDLWMFSLRRLTYPANKEVVSAFHFENGSWVETAPVTQTAGQYECPVADCAAGGKPVVAWTEIDAGQWVIRVSRFGENGFEAPHQLQAETGRSIDPVLIAPAKDRHWIAWENLHQGKLSICISRYDRSEWTAPVIISRGDNSCFNPAMAEAENGDLYVAYGVNQGYHQNIEMSIIDGRSLETKKIVPIAVGGGLKDRVNLNTKPALAFDAVGRLWISYENNRDAHRLDDGDNYTGDRCCAMLSYQDGKVVEPERTGKWLFSGKNDHKPTFIKDLNGRLYVATHCGGDFTGNPFWQYRLSWLDPPKGWVDPVTILQTSQKGALIPPAVAFDKKNTLWLATCIEKRFANKTSKKPDEVVRSLLTQLTATQFSTPHMGDQYASMSFRRTKVREFLPTDKNISQLSGHPKVAGEQITVDGEVYTLVYGNLHEHSENSPCWSAGTDGT
ncbi:MAG: hypothetical protein HQ515_12520, partial [Phycisphaeraceae bacterium]|nr:hypothetical protein [Phycisphaeraceae bacterium]